MAYVRKLIELSITGCEFLTQDSLFSHILHARSQHMILNSDYHVVDQVVEHMTNQPTRLQSPLGRKL